MGIAQQIRLSARSLIRAPAFAVTAALTLALGIGLSTAVFTVANAILFRELPVGDQDRVVVLWGETRDGRFSNYPLALNDARDFQRQSGSLNQVAFFEFRGATQAPIRDADRVYPIQIALVSGNFFDVLQSRPLLGRALGPEDDVAGAAPVIVLSHQAWQQHFGGDSAVVGRSITMMHSGRAHTIVGVMPKGLEYPRGAEVWAPVIAYATAGGFLEMTSFDLLARLAPGETTAQARDELTRFFQRSDAPAMYRGVRGVVHRLPEIIIGDTRPALVVVMLAAGLLVFITCVNVANLLLVRALGRVKDLVVRAAMGASRARLIAQLMIESALLAVAGGVLGVVLAVGVLRAFVAFAPASVPRLEEVGVSGAALVAAIVITSATMLLSGLGPAIFTSRVNAHEALRSASRSSGGPRMRRLAEALVVAQIALAAVSLTAAGLVTRSLVKLQQVDLSFASEQLLVANLAMRLDVLGDKTRQEAALNVVLETVQALPGVRDVSPVLAVPFSASSGLIDGRLSLPGQSAEESAKNPVLNMEIAAPNYFSMLGIPVVRGRSFGDEDREGSPPVIIVGSTVAQHFWPGADPIGKRLAMPGRALTVVGVVADTRYRDLLTPRPTVYFPQRQSPFPLVPATLLIRTAGSTTDVVPALRRAVGEAHPAVSVITASSAESLLDAPRAQPRLNAVVLALFAVTAVSLAAIGLFAIIATLVRQRTHEIGIRMALGATATDVRRMVMTRGLTLAVAGSAIGIVGALAMSRLLSALLFEVSPTDAVTLVAVAALMLLVAAIACFVPARTSMRIDPAIALRAEA
jgi:putative ABC transport system permease protein